MCIECDPSFYNGWSREWYICLKFWYRLQEIASKRHKMKCGFIVMTQKQDSRPLGGKSMLPKQLTIVTNGKFCIVWGRKSAEIIQNDCGTLTGSFTMAVYWHTAVLMQHCLVTKNMGVFQPSSLLSWFGPSWFFLVSENGIAAVVASFAGCPWYSGTVDDHLHMIPKSRFHWCFQQVAECWTN